MGREVEHSFPTTPDVRHNGSYTITLPTSSWHDA